MIKCDFYLLIWIIGFILEFRSMRLYCEENVIVFVVKRIIKRIIIIIMIASFILIIYLYIIILMELFAQLSFIMMNIRIKSTVNLSFNKSDI